MNKTEPYYPKVFCFWSDTHQQFPVNGNGDTAIPGDRAVGRAFARHLCRARARPTKHLSVHRKLLDISAASDTAAPETRIVNVIGDVSVPFGLF